MAIENAVLKTLLGIRMVFRYPKFLLSDWKPDLKPVERAVIDAIVEHADEHARGILESQLQEANYAERTYFKKSHLYLHKVKGLGYDLERKRKFDTDRDDQLFAVMSFDADGKSFTAEPRIVLGIFFNIDFVPSIKAHEKCESILVKKFDQRWHPLGELAQQL